MDKPKLTRKEAIRLYESLVSPTGAIRWVDFFIATGMLEVKEEEKQPILATIHSKLIKDVGVSIPITTLGQILAIIVEMGYEIKANNS